MLHVVRGMRDLYGSELYSWRFVEAQLATVAESFGYEEFRTPIVEHIELFKRGVGEHTDIVGKEMYVFEDRGGDVLTLRPEMTAPIVRAVIEHSLVRHKPTTRLWYMGPLFRYERPQKGRYRQFHQFGAELIGSANPEADAEIVLLAAEALRTLNAPDITLEINSLGSAESRSHYRSVLVDYLRSHASELSEESLRRLELNPLRILDSKDEGDRFVVSKAPLLIEMMSDADRDHFESVLAILKSAGVEATVQPRLVRGLDYYSHTVFEFTTQSLGAQNTVCGGGRYDPLFAMIGGADTPAVGFSIGVERLMLLLEMQQGGFVEQPRAEVYVCAMTSEARLPAQLIALRLRRAGIRVVTDLLRRSAKAQLKEADKLGAQWCVVLGEDELANNVVGVKNLKTMEQQTVPTSTLTDYLRSSTHRREHT